MDSDESSDDCQSNTYTNDLDDSDVDWLDENFSGLTLQDGPISISRTSTDGTISESMASDTVGIVTPTAYEAVVLTTDGTVALTISESMASDTTGIVTPTADEAVVFTTYGTEFPMEDGSVSPSLDGTVAPAGGRTETPTIDETDFDESSDNSQSVINGSDDFVPKDDLMDNNITGLSLQNDQMQISRTSNGTVAPSTEKFCVIKLLITYIKSEGEKVEDDTCLHRVQCNSGFLALWNFYNQTDCGRKMLEAILEKQHCHASLANDKPLHGVFLFQIFDQTFHNQSDVKKFVQDVLDTVDQNARKELFLDKFTVDPRLHDDVLERVRQTKVLDSVWIELGGEQGHYIYMVCLLEQKMFATQRISDIINVAEIFFQHHEELVDFDHMWQRVMLKFGYLEHVYNKCPNLIINWDESKNAFVLKGPRVEVRTALDTILELFETAKNEISEVSFAPVCQLDIFTHPEMCAYINRFISEVSVVWLVNHHTKKIHLFAKDPRQLHGIDKAIRGCVLEKFYPVSKDLSISTQKISRYLDELKKQHKGRLVINSSTAGLLVTTADDIHEIVDAAILEIISGEGDEDQDSPGPGKLHKSEEGRPSSKFLLIRNNGLLIKRIQVKVQKGLLHAVQVS